MATFIDTSYVIALANTADRYHERASVLALQPLGPFITTEAVLTEIGNALGFTAPPGVEAETLLQAGHAEPRCWWASLETIASNSYNLAAGRYKPQVAEPPPEENSAELIREVLAIEREITAGLEKLLQEIEA
jgi:hypothetical protein